MRVPLKTIYLGLLLTVVFVTSAQEQAKPLSVHDLGWMTGSWLGDIGPAKLQETWGTPTVSSMHAVVHSWTEEGTVFHEFIVLEDTDTGVALTLMQWNPGMRSRSAPTKMTSVAHSDRSVTFTAEGEGVISEITYSRPESERFMIEVTLASGYTETIPMSRVD